MSNYGIICGVLLILVLGWLFYNKQQREAFTGAVREAYHTHVRRIRRFHEYTVWPWYTAMWNKWRRWF